MAVADPRWTVRLDAAAPQSAPRDQVEPDPEPQPSAPAEAAGDDLDPEAHALPDRDDPELPELPEPVEPAEPAQPDDEDAEFEAELAREQQDAAKLAESVARSGGSAAQRRRPEPDARARATPGAQAPAARLTAPTLSAPALTLAEATRRRMNDLAAQVAELRVAIGDFRESDRAVLAGSSGIPSKPAPSSVAPFAPVPFDPLRPQDDSIAEWVRASHQAARQKGWWREARPVGELLALVHSEVSEALEEYRNGHGPDEIYPDEAKPEKPCGFAIELADVLLRVFDMAGAFKLDLAGAVAIKHEYNLTRPDRHGGKIA